jgi:hypothetical protein
MVVGGAWINRIEMGCVGWVTGGRPDRPHPARQLIALTTVRRRIALLHFILLPGFLGS